MCWFITVGIPRATRHLLERVANEHRTLSFWFLESTPTTDLFGAGDVCAQVTRGGCSCGLIRTSPADAEAELEKQRARLIKKGLSAAKIGNAIEAKAHALSSPKPISAETVAFGAVVSALVHASAGPRLYRHFYSGNQNTEVVPSPATASISLRELESDGFPSDTIVTVRALGQPFVEAALIAFMEVPPPTALCGRSIQTPGAAG